MRVSKFLAAGFLAGAWLGWGLTPSSLTHAAVNEHRKGEERLAAEASFSPGTKPGEKDSSSVRGGRAADPCSLIKRLLGVDARAATSPDLSRYRLSVPGAVVIIFAYPHSPLANAGFEAEDMIMEVEGRPVDGLQGFAEELLRRRAKQRILMLGLDHRTGRVGYVQVVVPDKNVEGGLK